MRNFDYITNPAKLLTPEIVQMVGMRAKTVMSLLLSII